MLLPSRFRSSRSAQRPFDAGLVHAAQINRICHQAVAAKSAQPQLRFARKTRLARIITLHPQESMNTPCIEARFGEMLT
jgi:hypothetical protein